MIAEDDNLLRPILVSQPIYLISALGMKGRFSCSMLSRFSANHAMSIELVRIPCARTPYVRVRTLDPFPTRWAYCCVPDSPRDNSPLTYVGIVFPVRMSFPSRYIAVELETPYGDR